jgi:hypothetical protein
MSNPNQIAQVVDNKQDTSFFLGRSEMRKLWISTPTFGFPHQ